MDLSAIKVLNSPTVLKATRTVAKWGPEILTGLGIAGSITSTVLVARATLKLEPILAEFESRVAELKLRQSFPEMTDAEMQKQLVYVYFWFAAQLTKLYGPGVTMGLASIASILGAHGIMKRRQVALLAAFKTVETAFNQYRQRVIEEFGEEKDRDYRLGIREEKITDPETGKTKKVRTRDAEGHSLYARVWSKETAPGPWDPSPEYNYLFLKQKQNYWNDRLQQRKIVFLNEVYQDIGLSVTPEGQMVGWYINSKEKPVGDSYIDFGMYESNSDKLRDFVNGENDSILLDFNVDGSIIDKI